MKGWAKRQRGLLLLVTLGLLAGCATRSSAPVEDRAGQGRRGVLTPAPVTDPSGVVVGGAEVPPPGSYVVKKGDTLFSIALENGQDWRDVAAWNGLDNPNLIRIGQALRVRPLETVVNGDNKALETKPLEPGAAVTRGNGGVRSEPRGGKLAYSDQALTAAQKGEEPKPAAKPLPPAAQASPPSAPSSPPAKAPEAAEEGDWAWPANGKLVGSFSESSNKGIDIAGQLGDTVSAAAAGKVVYVGSGLRGYGNLVIIKHDATYLSAYAHNQKVLVKEGQTVRKGQEIALLGESDADRPKLHFEIRRQGKPVDPAKYLPKR